VAKIKFVIDHKDFFCDPHLIRDNQFSIHSTLKDYLVSFKENSSPVLEISNLLNQNKKNLLLIDKNIFKLYQSEFNISPERIFIADATEFFKTLDGVTAVLNFLQKNELSKNEALIVVGGGITQEVGAFVAAIYKRGIPWHYFPTTLLSMCDSCIGGKASINYNNAKNQLGLFSPPTQLIIYPEFLKTLSRNDIQSGLGEILKLCIIGGEYFIKLYQSHVTHGNVTSQNSFRYLIEAALCIKKSVVEEDEFETNYRRSMNYGHTLGHAIESLSHYKISHGQAVVIGMILANDLSYQKKLLNKAGRDFLNQLCFDLLDKSVLLYLRNINFDNIIDFIQKDKKTMGEYIYFVLIKALGETCFEKFKIDEQLFLDIQIAFKTI